MTGANKLFSARRKLLCDQMLDDSIAIVGSSHHFSRNSDSLFPFRQDSNFLYLSGFAEAESVLVIRSLGKKKEFIMFCRDRDPLREQWDGFRAGPKGALSSFGADEAYSISELDKVMPSLFKGVNNIYYSMKTPNGINLKLERWLDIIRANVRQGSEAPNNLISLDLILDEMRLLKSEKEVENMRRACEITSNAHIRAMQKVTPEMFEYQLEAEYIHQFMDEGARYPAYNSIVGGGNNACILHYNENKSRLKAGELVLVDAGCEYQYYASDVTRTFPVSKKFTEEQKQIYKIVLEAHNQACKAVKPGTTWDKVHKTSVKVITEGLMDIGILRGNFKDLINKCSYEKFYMHRIGHWLGLDVHDVGNYKKNGEWRKLEKGMVLTIEPGVYILDSLKGVDKKWLGIGVRIEDDLLVTGNGHEVLTDKAPREISDIENIK